MDGGVERSSQVATCNEDGRGEREGAQVDSVASARPPSYAAEGREERSKTIQGASEKICHVEAEGHVGIGKGMKDGSCHGGEETDEGGS